MMATQTIARPAGAAQTLRQRREARPGVGRAMTRAGTAEDLTDTPRKDVPEPYVRTADYVLKKFEDRPPSLVVHLHPTHFRFEQQDGNFSYSSPMRIFLQHLKQQTVPHEMLDELFQCDVPFYDGCLIVHVHDHKTGATPSQSTSSTMNGGGKSSPYSVHNWNEHVTPSPFVPFPTRNGAKAPINGVRKDGEKPEGATDGKDADKESMPAPDQPASKKANQVRVLKTVLFPTAQSLHEERGMLLRTPYADSRNSKKANGSMAPPTPLASVPPTPLTSKGPPAKRQRMVLDASNVHEWEAEVINAMAPPLFLEPAKDPEHMVNIMEFLSDPLQPKAVSAPNKRKRTTAELQADEALAAEEERFMLIQDERVQPSSTASAAGTGAANSENQTAGSKFEPTFSSFKTLENIKMRHEEQERQKKEEEHRATILRNQQKEQEQQRRKEEAERNAAAANRLAQQRAQQEEMMKKQQAQHNQAQHAQLLAAQHARNAQMQAQLQQQQQAMQQATTAAQMSPIVSQQTPMATASSPLVNGMPVMPQPMMGVPMSATSSAQGGAGSPARPASAVSHHAGQVPMARQVSQQTSQRGGSAHGTPQMNQSTPMMNHAMPATSRNMTPQPRPIQHGSPAPGMQQGTPAMMSTPQMTAAGMNMNGLTREQQMQMFARVRQMQQQQQAQQAQQQQGSPQGVQAAMSPDQMAAQIQAMQNSQRMQQQQNLMGNMSPEYQQRMRAQQIQQMQQMGLQQRQMQAAAAAAGMNGQQGQQQQMGGNPMMGQISQQGNQMGHAQGMNQQQQQQQQMAAGQQQQGGAVGGINPQSIPPQMMQQARAEWQARMMREIQTARTAGRSDLTAAIQSKYKAGFQNFLMARVAGLRQQMAQRAGGNPGAPGNGMNLMAGANGMMNGGGMQPNGAGGGGGSVDPNYVAQLQQQQARMLAQQQQQAQLQRMGMAGGAGGQVNGFSANGMSMQQMQQQLAAQQQMQQQMGMGRGMQ